MFNDTSKTKKVSFMSSLAEASHLVRLIGGDAESKKERRLKAWRKLAAHFTWNRIVDLDRGARHARPSGDEMKLLRAAARQQDEAEREGRNEYREVVERLARLEARLLSIDEDFHRESARALRAASGMDSERDGGFGDVDSPVDHRER